MILSLYSFPLQYVKKERVGDCKKWLKRMLSFKSATYSFCKGINCMDFYIVSVSFGTLKYDFVNFEM
jgi:hypothetical protein